MILASESFFSSGVSKNVNHSGALLDGLALLTVGSITYALSLVGTDMVKNNLIPTLPMGNVSIQAMSAFGTKLGVGASLVNVGITATALAYIAPAVVLFASGATMYYSHYVYQYMTRYPQPKDSIENTVNKLNALRLAKQLDGLLACIVDGYSPSFWTSSSSSSELHQRARKLKNSDDIVDDVIKYLTRSDGKSGYYNNGKRLYNVLLSWVNQHAEPKIQLQYIHAPKQSSSCSFLHLQQENSSTDNLPPQTIVPR